MAGTSPSFPTPQNDEATTLQRPKRSDAVAGPPYRAGEGSGEISATARGQRFGAETSLAWRINRATGFSPIAMPRTSLTFLEHPRRAVGLVALVEAPADLVVQKPVGERAVRERLPLPVVVPGSASRRASGKGGRQAGVDSPRRSPGARMSGEAGNFMGLWTMRGEWESQLDQARFRKFSPQYRVSALTTPTSRRPRSP
jgi:hypothetical protein